MSASAEVARLVDMLPADEQEFALSFVKRLVRAWDPDFTKVTPAEKKRIAQAEESGFVSDKDINWDDLSAFA